MTPIEQLPYVDDHRERVDASREVTWQALVDTLRSDLGGSRRLARVLGCDPAEPTAAFEGRAGETLPGFAVLEAARGERLALRGHHRFADYALTFFLGEGELRAETRAAFPGAAGRLYRALVIGSGAHARVTRRMLRRVARAARRGAAAARHEARR